MYLFPKNDFEEAFEAAITNQGPSVIELVVSEEAISPAFTLTELIEQSLEKRKESPK